MANNSVQFNIKLKVDGKEQVVQATTSVDNLRSVVDSAKDATQRLNETMVNATQHAQLWQNLSSGIQALSGTLNQLTQESRSFGGAMTAVNTMAGKSSEDFASLKAQVADLAKTVPIARDELANGLYQVISNGVPENNWMSFLEQSTKASVGGLADLSEVVKVTSTIIKTYGLEWSDAQSVQDKIQLTAKNGVTTFEEMAQALPRVSANAATLGVSVDELMASFATLTSVSGNTAEVSTQLAAIFTALIKPSSEAATMAEQMGIQFDAAAIKAAGGFTQFLSQLNAQVKSFAQSSGMLEQEIYGKLFGSAESLRAITPLVGSQAEKFEQNAQQMQNSAGTIEDAFSTMASTASAKLQMMNNEIGAAMDVVTAHVGNMLPVLNIGSQLAVTAASIMSLKTSIMGLVSSIAGATGITKLWREATISMNAIMQVCSATMRGTAVSATTLRIAIRGLMVATGVGIAVAALTEVINYLSSSSSDAAGNVDQLSEAEQRAKQAHEQTAQQIASVRSEMDLNIAKLKDFSGSKEQEKTLVQQMNAKYGEALGYYSTVSQWYQALTANSEAYCNQMINEIRLRDLANRAAELDQKQHDIKYNADGTLRKYSTKNKTVTKTTGQVDAGDGKVIPIKQEVEVKGTSQLAQANKQMTSLYQQSQNVRKQMQQIVAANNKIKPTKVEGWSATPPPAGGGSGKGGGTTTTPGTTKTEKPAPLQGSIDWYQQQISDLNEQLNATADAGLRKNLQTTIEGFQRELGMLKVEAGIDVVPKIEVKKDEKSIIEQIDEEIADFNQNLDPIVIDVEGAEALRNLDKLQQLNNIDLTNFMGVQNALQNIKTITDPTAKGFAAAGASCEALGGALQQLGADSAAAKAGMMMAAIGQLVLSFAQALASTNNWITWLAFGISGTAQLVSMISTMSQFATGGIVGGNEKSGDKVLVRVNSGEMILNAAQQARLFALANGAAVYGTAARVATGFNQGLALPQVTVQSGKLQGLISDDSAPRQIDVRMKVRGRDIVVAAANETRSNRRRSNIKI